MKLIMSFVVASVLGTLIRIVSLIPRAMQRWEISAGSASPIHGFLISAVPMPWLAIVVTPIVFWTLLKIRIRFCWEVHLLVASCGFLFLVGALIAWTLLGHETEMLAPGPVYSASSWSCNFVYVALFATCLVVSLKPGADLTLKPRAKVVGEHGLDRLPLGVGGVRVAKGDFPEPQCQRFSAEAFELFSTPIFRLAQRNAKEYSWANPWKQITLNLKRQSKRTPLQLAP